MIEDSDLDAAVAAGLLDPALRTKLVSFAAKRRQTASDSAAETAAPSPKFESVHVLYYAGALIIIGAMGLFANAAFDNLGGWALTAIGLAIFANTFVTMSSLVTSSASASYVVNTR